ncbi:unnamed protein product [Zymoseptoria tritici ST99CH_1E4]|nr:unnamed protein product [Zymoseptoria tritici ST99CH_1E4]
MLLFFKATLRRPLDWPLIPTDDIARLKGLPKKSSSGFKPKTPGPSSKRLGSGSGGDLDNDDDGVGDGQPAGAVCIYANSTLQTPPKPKDKQPTPARLIERRALRSGEGHDALPGAWALTNLTGIADYQKSISGDEDSDAKEGQGRDFEGMPFWNVLLEEASHIFKLVNKPEQIWHGRVWHSNICVTLSPSTPSTSPDHRSVHLQRPLATPTASTKTSIYAPLAVTSLASTSPAFISSSSTLSVSSAAPHRPTRASATEQKKQTRAQEMAEKRAEAAAMIQRAHNKAAAEVTGQKLGDSQNSDHRGYIGGSISLSDIIHFRCRDYHCKCRTGVMHLGRFLAPVHDQRTVRKHAGERCLVFVKIQRLVDKADVPGGLQAGNEVLVRVEDENVGPSRYILAYGSANGPNPRSPE